MNMTIPLTVYKKETNVRKKDFHFGIMCGMIYQKRIYVRKICSISGREENLMRNTAGTTQEMRRKENHKCSKTMAVILGLIVTLEVMIAGGMIFNIDFHSADIITLIFGAGVVFSAAVAVLTDN